MSHRILVPFEPPDAAPVSRLLVEDLAGMQVVLLGHYALPEQTPPEAARDQFEEQARAELDALASAFQILVSSIENLALVAFRESDADFYQPEFTDPGPTASARSPRSSRATARRSSRATSSRTDTARCRARSGWVAPSPLQSVERRPAHVHDASTPRPAPAETMVSRDPGGRPEAGASDPLDAQPVH